MTNIFEAITNFFRRLTDMDSKTVTTKLEKANTDAVNAAAQIASLKKTVTTANATIDALTQSGAAKDAQITDLKAQIAAASGGQDSIMQQIADGLDAIDKTLTAALAAS